MKKQYEPLINPDIIKSDLKQSKGDIGHKLIKSGLSGVPLPGSGLVAELFEMVIEPPLSKRRDRWIYELGEAILELENRIESFKVDTLIKNESFLTVFMHAYQLAIRNHHEEKLEALRNAVLNSALPNALEDDLKIIFLNITDSFTVTHIKLLNFFNESKSREWIENLESKFPSKENYVNDCRYDNISVKTITFDFNEIMEYMFPDYIQNNIVFHLAFNDFKFYDMFYREGIDEIGIIPIDGRVNPSIQPFGKKFMDFITFPKLLD